MICENDEENDTEITALNLNQSNASYDSAVDEAEKQLLDVNMPVAIDCSRLRSRINSETEKNGSIPLRLNLTSPFSQQENKLNKANSSNLRDINAMSVASIYDKENNDIMDADK